MSLADGEAWERENPIHAMSHYCSGCKRMVPACPGIVFRRWQSVGVAHVINESMMFSVPCRPQRTYSEAEQIRNWEKDELWDLE